MSTFIPTLMYTDGDTLIDNFKMILLYLQHSFHCLINKKSEFYQ